MSQFKFGKYKGEHICDVPVSYLKWLEEQSWLDPILRQEVQHEIEVKEGNRPGKGFVKTKITIK